MKMQFIYKSIGILMLCYTSTVSAQSIGVHDLYRLKKSTSQTSRPRIPAKTSDYINCIVDGETMTLQVEDNLLPAVINIMDDESNFRIFNYTLTVPESINTGLPEGSYTISVTLVNTITYTGEIIINQK